jgi:hypothetical protein
MPRIKFEPATPVLQRAKTVHALDRAATMIDYGLLSSIIIPAIIISPCVTEHKTRNTTAELLTPSVFRRPRSETLGGDTPANLKIIHNWSNKI